MSMVNNVGPLPVGQAVTLTCVFSVDDTDTDPTDVYFTWDAVTTNGGQLVAPTYWHYGVTGSIQKTATGIYTAQITPSAAGLWRVRWAATGAVVAASDGTFTVSSSPLSPP